MIAAGGVSIGMSVGPLPDVKDGIGRFQGKLELGDSEFRVRRRGFNGLSSDLLCKKGHTPIYLLNSLINLLFSISDIEC